ncbi:MAG: hypothetical protein AAB658_13545, partial [Chloroflexota bacterium]
AYFKADKHDSSGKTIGTVSYYVSQEYRQSIRASNKAAEKYLSVSGPQFIADIQAFMISGGEDSYTPISCD